VVISFQDATFQNFTEPSWLAEASVLSSCEKASAITGTALPRVSLESMAGALAVPQIDRISITSGKSAYHPALRQRGHPLLSVTEGTFGMAGPKV